jgi:catechol-2,3-dioxygenase
MRDNAMAQAAQATSNAKERVPLSMSHIGIYVRDIAAMEDFYTRVLGFTVTDRGQVRGNDIVFTSWDARDHHQVILVAGRPEDHAFNHINQMSFRVASVEDLQAVWRNVKDEPGVTDMRGMDHGNAWSLYFRDPEGNRLEIFCDTQWYISQPCLEDLDLSLPAEQIRARSDAFCRSAPGFKPIAEYQAEVARKIGRDR